MKLRLFEYETYEDFGKEWFLQLLTSRKFALLYLTLQWDDYGSDDFFPMLIANIGSKCLFGFTFRWGRFEISAELIDSAPRDLRWYRENYDE